MMDTSSGGMGPPVRTLIRAATDASRAVTSGRGPEVVGAMDDLRKAASVLQRWAAAHPGDEPGLTDRLMVLAARCGFVALVADQASDGPDGSIAGQLDVLLDELAAIVDRRQLDSSGSDIG